MMNGAFQDFPDFQTIRGFSIQPFMANVMEMFNINASDRHTRFLNSMVHINKKIRFPATIKKITSFFMVVKKNFVQIDQSSDIDVVSAGCVNFFIYLFIRFQK